ncbi:MAG: hypothetical protein IPH12_19330 [Saprospirales bacterium]|nr:hypothetical protein [Saprospirales bacterium]MBK8920419.1 hypothetical protein [Saprospirales bacterium]
MIPRLFSFFPVLILLLLLLPGAAIRRPGPPPAERPHCCPAAGASPDWGFFAHRRINRLAVLSLPPEMMVFFKKNIDWISDHAVDADMRRYAATWEAPRHYIDLDEYGQPPFDSLPRTLTEALLRYADVWGVSAAGDTILLFGGERPEPHTPEEPWRAYFRRYVTPQFTDPEKQLQADTLRVFLQRNGLEAPALQAAFFRESLSAHGILPWHLQKMQRDITDAFRRRDSKRLLRLCADMGHYIGDAHVPLHTTSNYNGQKTGQTGIHGFWESRIPELFADEQYDYFTGKPLHVQRTTDYFWGMVLSSNSMVDSVLDIERALRLRFPPDRQMCPDMRNGVVFIAPCRDFAAAYQQALDGMVERRMRAAIHAVASAWYTAWVDAGQPDLSQMDPLLATEEDRKEAEALQTIYGQGKILGRPEEH